MLRAKLGMAVLSLSMAGCLTSRPDAKPAEMSVAAHEQQASVETQAANEHVRKYDPNEATARVVCPPGSGRYLDRLSEVCWTSVSNPTERNLQAAAQHRRHGASHRAASAQLREAETRACAGISAEDRDMSPFEHTEDIASVTPLVVTEARPISKRLKTEIVGATVTFRPVAGMSASWLQRVVDCHLARNAALGNVVPEMPDCPLVPRGAKATVIPSGEGLSVQIRSDDPNSAKEILSRAQRLVPPPAVSSIEGAPF